jgi:hypothetical protein
MQRGECMIIKKTTHDALVLIMQCNYKKDLNVQSFIEYAPQTSSKGKMSWCYNKRVHSIYFSLKCFLQKSITKLVLEKLSHTVKQEALD